MHLIQKITEEQTLENAVALCPKCYFGTYIGDIRAKYTVDIHCLGPLMIPHISALEKTVHFYCKCNTRMILIDAPIRRLIVKLNEGCFFTRFSCDGQSGGVPYIGFYEMSQIVAILRHLMNRNHLTMTETTKALNPNDDEVHYTTRYSFSDSYG